MLFLFVHKNFANLCNKILFLVVTSFQMCCSLIANLIIAAGDVGLSWTIWKGDWLEEGHEKMAKIALIFVVQIFTLILMFGTCIVCRGCDKQCNKDTSAGNLNTYFNRLSFLVRSPS